MTQDDGDEGEGLMDGFETGSGLELDDLPDEPGVPLEVQDLEIRSSAFDEIDLEEAQKASWAPPDAADPVVDEDSDWTVEHIDAGSSTVPIDTSGEAGGDVGSADVERFGEAGWQAGPSGLELLERQRSRSGGRRLVAAATAVLVLGGGGLAMGYFGVVQIPGITPPDRITVVVRAPVVLPGPQPETPVMSHVVVVDTWREVETPLAWAAALRERMPDLLGFATALTIDGERRYALVVGPAYNEAEATDLKRPLATAFALLNPDPASWTVREAPYSFFLGEYEGLDQANSRVQELASLLVPAFVLRVDYSAGAAAFRVYGGAFADGLEAVGMARLLKEHGLDETPLTERRGLLPE